MTNRISLHTRHDANITVSRDDQVILIFECERFFTQRYFQFSRQEDRFREQIDAVLSEVSRLTRIETYDDCILNWVPDDHSSILRELVPAKRFLETTHHRAHAAGAYFLSPFDECLILSTDGGGNDGWFNIYEGRNRRVKLLKRLDLNLGSSYRMLGNFIREIKSRKEFEFRRGLDIAGKLMGLAAYGRHDPVLYQAAKRAMMAFKKPQDIRHFAKEVGIPFEADCLDEQEGRNLAYCVQEAIVDILEEIFEEHKDLANCKNVCLTGGCALNVISNSNLAEKFPDFNFYVPPNPNDCGIALGSLCDLFPTTEVQECAWFGIPLLDLDRADEFKQRFPHVKAGPSELADVLDTGKIIGVVEGRSEHGPRALGNRSILASPAFPNIKDLINKKIKHREPYRPFAPIAIEEEVDRYFDLPARSPYMSFAAMVREEYREHLAGITHVDGTSRVQTLSADDHPLMYAILQATKEKTGVSVLLNTSLNIQGKPIVSRLSEAFEALEKTDLDYIYFDGSLFEAPTD